jgi:formate hydrogenlyase subunit 3/multisubunit Na+/H+ antiporter MnhD subunit
MPVTSLAFTVGAFSLVGLPPFIGFPSKFLIVRAALATKESLFAVLIGLALLGTVIEAAYFFRIVQVLYFRGSENKWGRKEVPVVALIPIVVFVILILGIGIYPKLITDVINSAASELLNRMDYIGNVLG